MLMLPVEKITRESSNSQTYYFRYKLDAKPGQFVMLWVPELDQKPMSVSYQDKTMFGLTVMCVGPFTKKLCAVKEGTLLGIQGPYGNSFSVEGKVKDVVLVGGGCGAAPMAFLAEELANAGKNVTVINGALSEENLIFKDRFLGNKRIKTIFCTNDGSFGEKGFTTDILSRFLGENKVDKVYSCGPELMMKKVFEICEEREIECEASLERYMKCGIGLCGNCCIDDQLVCKDGPVFNSEKLRKLSEFGEIARDKTGKKVSIEEY